MISGVFYSSDSLPAGLAAVAEALPLKHVIDGFPDAIVTGGGLGDHVEALVVLVTGERPASSCRCATSAGSSGSGAGGAGRPGPPQTQHELRRSGSPSTVTGTSGQGRPLHSSRSMRRTATSARDASVDVPSPAARPRGHEPESLERREPPSARSEGASAERR